MDVLNGIAWDSQLDRIFGTKTTPDILCESLDVPSVNPLQASYVPVL